MHCPSGVSKVANLCVHCQRDHLQKTGEHNGLGDFHTVRSKTITGLEGGEGGDAHRLSDSIRTASGSDETIAQVSSPLGSALSARIRHLTIPGRKKTTKKNKKTYSPPRVRGVASERTRTGHRVWMSGCWMLTGRAPSGRSVDNFSTLESCSRPALSASQGSRACPPTPPFTGCMSEEEEEGGGGGGKNHLCSAPLLFSHS